MTGGGKDNDIKIFVSETPKKYNKDFLDKLNKKRIEIISEVILRLASENKL